MGFTIDQERTKQKMDIIEQVKKYPCLYSREDVNFRNDVKMELCFIQIAKDLNSTVVQVKKTWRSLRNAGQDHRKKLCRLSLTEGPVRRPFFRYEKALEFCLQAYPQPSPDCEWVVKQPVPSKPRKRLYSLKRKGKGKRKRKPSSSSDSEEEEVDLVDLENDGPQESVTTRTRSGGKLYALGKEWRTLATNDEDPDGVTTPKGMKWQWDERLIQLVRERPILYDFTLGGQKQDVEEMNKAWAEIADIIGGKDRPVGVPPVKARWKGLRDQHWAYVKRLRAGNPGRSRLSFSHADSMEFLIEFTPSATDLGLEPGMKPSRKRIRESLKHSKAAPTAAATSVTPPGTSTENLAIDSIQEFPYEDEASYNNEDDYDDSPHNMETKNYEAPPPDHEAHRFESFVTVPAAAVADDIDHYLCSLAPALRRIHAQNPKKCAEVKIKFMQILAEAEYSE